MYKTCANRNHLKVATLSSVGVHRYWNSSLQMSKAETTSYEAQNSNPKPYWDIYYNRKAAYEAIANQSLNNFKTNWVRIPTLSNVIKTSNYDWTQSITSDFVRSRGKPTEKAFTNMGLVVDKNVAKAEVGPEEAVESVVSKIAEAILHNDTSDEQKADSNTIDEEITLEDKRIDGLFTKHLGRTAQLKKMSDFDIFDTETQLDNRFYDFIDNLSHNNAVEVYEVPKKEIQTETHESSVGNETPKEKSAVVPDGPAPNPDAPDKVATIEEIESTEIGPPIVVKESNQSNMKTYQDSVVNVVEDGGDMAKVEQPLNSDINKSSNVAAAEQAPVVIATQLNENEVADEAPKRVIPEGGVYLRSESQENEPADIREMFRVEISSDSMEPRTVVIDNMQPT